MRPANFNPNWEYAKWAAKRIARPNWNSLIKVGELRPQGCQAPSAPPENGRAQDENGFRGEGMKYPGGGLNQGNHPIGVPPAERAEELDFRDCKDRRGASDAAGQVGPPPPQGEKEPFQPERQEIKGHEN